MQIKTHPNQNDNHQQNEQGPVVVVHAFNPSYVGSMEM
jgi:hypothetical protein